MGNFNYLFVVCFFGRWVVRSVGRDFTILALFAENNSINTGFYERNVLSFGQSRKVTLTCRNNLIEARQLIFLNSTHWIADSYAIIEGLWYYKTFLVFGRNGSLTISGIELYHVWSPRAKVISLVSLSITFQDMLHTSLSMYQKRL